MSIYTALSAALGGDPASLPAFANPFSTPQAMGKIARGAIDLPVTQP